MIEECRHPVKGSELPGTPSEGAKESCKSTPEVTKLVNSSMLERSTNVAVYCQQMA